MIHSIATIPDLLIRGLSRSPDSTAIIQGEREFTRRELAAEISRYSQVLAASGLNQGSSFALLAPSRVESLITQVAAQIIGARMTLLSAASSIDDQRYILQDAKIEFLLIDAEAFPKQAQALSEVSSLTATIPIAGGSHSLGALATQYDPAPLIAPVVAPEDISSVAYTGGTTGRPKGVIGTYRSGATLTQIQLAEWQWPTPLRTLVCTPLTHAGGTLFLPTLLRGGHIIVLDHFTPEAFFAAVQKHKITATLLVPTMINALLRHAAIDDYDLSSLETILYGAAPIRPAVLQQAIDKFGSVFFQFYGQTECGMTISVLKKEEHTPENFGTCGRPVPWLDVSLRNDNGERVETGEVGEICVRGPLVMAGYWNLPESTEDAFRGGWLHTGDLARQDERGFLTIVDRNKDMIVTGGFNVYSAEVESVIAESPGVVDAAVLGVPDEYWGEAVTALVVETAPGTVNTEEMLSLVRARKGAVHTPKNVFVVEELPKTPLGKIDKKACTELAMTLLG